MLSQEDFLNLDRIRVPLRPSKTTITTQNVSQVDCNLGDLSYGHFLEPLPFGITEPFYGEVLPLLSLGSRFECFMSAGHEAVIYMEMCAVSE